MTAKLDGTNGVIFPDGTTQSTAGVTPSSNQIAKAWVVTDAGSSTVYASYNVSSVTYVNNGNRTVNFTSSFSNADYCAVIGTSATSDIYARPFQINTQSTSNCTFFGTGGTYSGRLGFAFFK